MEQMNVEEEKKIKIDFEAVNLPKSVKVFRPLLFHEGSEYFCVLGPSPQEGVFGSGETEEEALVNWDNNLKKCKESNNTNDEVTQYVIDTLNTSVDDVW